MSKETKRGLFATTLLAGLAFSVPAMAQQAEPAAPADTETDAIVVTGSRIPQANLVTTSPVTQVTGEDLKEAGVTRVEDLVNQLPQVFAAQNATVANGSTGTATVDLRGLGAERTLVLINGRRMPYGSYQVGGTAPDLNTIPGQLIERVEVLTGGASAVYGSDAIAGVVNFMMKKDYEGVQIDAQYSFFQHNNDYDGVGNMRAEIARRGATNPSQFKLPDDNVVDGYGKEITGIMGVSTPDGRGNVTAYAAYRVNDAITQGQRDFSACSVGAPEAARPSTFTCGGSPTNATGNFTDFVNFQYTVDPVTGNFRDLTPDDLYNFGPSNFYQRPDERYSFGAFGHYEFNKHAEAYVELMFNNTTSVAQVAPGGLFIGDVAAGIACDNPLLSAQQAAAICNVDLVPDIVDDPTTPENELQDFIDQSLDVNPSADTAAYIAAAAGVQNALTGSSPTFNPDGSVGLTPFNGVSPVAIGRRNVEGGGRQESFDNTSYRLVGGLRGNLVEGWDYDVYGQFSRSTLNTSNLNYFSKQRLARALDVVTDPDTGNPVCRSVLDGTDTSCVPYNIYSPGGVTAEALRYLQVPGIENGATTQQVVNASLTGDLGTLGLKSPAAERAFATAFGVEYRRDTLDLVTDIASQSFDLSGTGGPTIGLSGETEVVDFFAELQTPLIEGRPFAELLSLDFAYRRSSYQRPDLDTDTYKAGAEWAPVEGLRFRASYQKAVRAPNVVELFAPQGFNLFDLDGDPCGPVTPGVFQATLAQCTATGVPAAFFRSAALNSPAGQYNFLAGGNPNVDPEESETNTFGLVFNPNFIPGLTVSIDYFDIEVTGLIGTTGAENIINQCYQGNVAAACARITRNSIGQLWIGDGNVEDLNTNIGGLKTSGVDVSASYNLDFDALGSFDFSIVGTWLESLETDTGLGNTYDCVGFYGSVCGIPNPEWRHRARVAWSTPWGAEVAGTWRYYGEVDIYTGGTATTRIDRHFDAENYFDLSGSMNVFDNTRLRVGVNNVLDNDPPLSYSVGTTGNGNTYPQTYDSLGRYFFAGLTVDF